MTYIHYNLRLRLKHIQEKVELKHNDPLHNVFVYDREHPIIGWLEDRRAAISKRVKITSIVL